VRRKRKCCLWNWHLPSVLDVVADAGQFVHGWEFSTHQSLVRSRCAVHCTWLVWGCRSHLLLRQDWNEGYLWRGDTQTRGRGEK
jgi:hypothetical protein